MVALWYLLILAPFIAIPILWWHYRRKQVDREQMVSERWQKIVSKTAIDEDVAAVAAKTAAVVPTQSVPAAAAVRMQYRRRDRLLDPSHTLMYYLLRTGLAECEVLAQVSLDRLLMLPSDTADLERERRIRGLAQHVVAFVICDKSMQPLAAVDLLEGGAPAALTAAPDYIAQCLAHSGLRYVRIARTALPKRHEVRALVLGEGAGG